jgi:hypothetical protein
MAYGMLTALLGQLGLYREPITLFTMRAYGMVPELPGSLHPLSSQ